MAFAAPFRTAPRFERSTFRPHMDHLEERTLMSVTSVFHAAVGRLAITGDADPDHIVVASDPAGNITVAGEVVAGARTDTVRWLDVRGGPGNDLIDASGLVNFSAYIVLDGQDGNDTILGSPAADQIFGGIGDDILDGGAGADYLYGWKGRDTLYGTVAEDTLSGGPDHDQVHLNFDLDTFVRNRGRRSISPDEYSTYHNGGTDTYHVTVGIGGFARDVLQPAVGEVQKLTKSFQPIVDAYYTKVPLLADYLDSSLTFGKVLESVTGANLRPFVSAIRTINDLDLANLSGRLFVGTFDVSGVDRIVRKTSGSSLGLLNGGGVLQGLKDIGFRVTPLHDPAQALKSVFGVNTDLVSFKMPDLKLAKNVSKTFTIFGIPKLASIDVGIGGWIELQARGRAAYDLTGIHAGRPINGFYIEGAYARFEAGLKASASAGIPKVIQVGVSGHVQGSIRFTLHDPNRDGQVRYAELAASARVFDVTGKIGFGLSVFITHIKPKGTWFKPWTWDIGTATHTWKLLSGSLTLKTVDVGTPLLAPTAPDNAGVTQADDLLRHPHAPGGSIVAGFTTGLASPLTVGLIGQTAAS